LCAPIVSAAGVVIGIIDAESFTADHFADSARAAAVLLACELLGECDLLRELLV
jgi:putative methionine-R-sulfoxide reductase with GAF domain